MPAPSRGSGAAVLAAATRLRVRRRASDRTRGRDFRARHLLADGTAAGTAAVHPADAPRRCSALVPRACRRVDAALRALSASRRRPHAARTVEVAPRAARRRRAKPAARRPEVVPAADRARGRGVSAVDGVRQGHAGRHRRGGAPHPASASSPRSRRRPPAGRRRRPPRPRASRGRSGRRRRRRRPSHR